MMSPLCSYDVGADDTAILQKRKLGLRETHRDPKESRWKPGRGAVGTVALRSPAEANRSCEFEAGLGYIASSSPAGAPQK